MGEMYLLPQKKSDDNKSKSIEIKEILGDEIEENIYFSDVYIGFLYTFNIEIKNILSKKEIQCLLKDKGINAEWNENEEYTKVFESAEVFFKAPVSVFTKPLRFKIGYLYFKCPHIKYKENIECMFDKPTKIELFLTIYPKLKKAILLFNIKLESCDSNDIIFLRHCFMGDRQELILDIERSNPKICKTCNKFKIDCGISKHYYKEFKIDCDIYNYSEEFKIYLDICEHYKKYKRYCERYKTCKKVKIDCYINFIKSAFSEVNEEKSDQSEKKIDKTDTEKSEEENTSCPIVVKTNIIEIRNISNLNYLNVDNCEDDLLSRYPRQIYSLLVGDEGWKFVPRKLAISRIKKRWGTRGFFTVFTFNNSVLVFNFTKTNHYKIYGYTQKELSKRFRQKTDEYFTLCYEIAGLEHGPLTNLEIASVIRCSLDTLFEKLDDKKSELNYENEDNIVKKFRSCIFNHKKIENINRMKNAVNTTLLDLNKMNKIWELGELLNMFSESLSISKDILKLEKKSNFIETKIMTEYQKNNNLILSVLTLLTVILTFLGIICAVYEI
ncbi:MAG: hypothetical protein PHW56_00870 [Methanosarcinaceae archaeon]|nr:hypothetical protein [Methanosarcinaceae archaeon]